MKVYVATAGKWITKLFPTEDAAREQFAADEVVGVDIPPEILEAAYRERKNEYMREDAMTALCEFVGAKPDTMECTPEEEQRFAEKYGFDWHEAADETSAHFILDEVVRRYENRFTTEYGEYDQWQSAVRDALEDRIPPMQTVQFGMYWQEYGRQTIRVPASVDLSDRDAVIAYIREHWDDVGLPEGSYVTDSAELDDAGDIICC